MLMPNLEIRVTKNDIEKGKAQDSKDCPIARAIRRKIKKNKKTIWVSDGGVGINGKLYDHTNESFDFMQNFDRDIPVKPAKFSFPFMNVTYRDIH